MARQVKKTSSKAKTKTVALKVDSKKVSQAQTDKRQWQKMTVALLAEHLELLAQGKTAKEAAAQMGLEQPTYLARLRNAGVSIRKVKRQFEKGTTPLEIAEKMVRDPIKTQKSAKKFSETKIGKRSINNLMASLNELFAAQSVPLEVRSH